MHPAVTTPASPHHHPSRGACALSASHFQPRSANGVRGVVTPSHALVRRPMDATTIWNWDGMVRGAGRGGAQVTGALDSGAMQVRV
eukprot:64752-Chlamydomonas_euryale.AAC.11